MGVSLIFLPVEKTEKNEQHECLSRLQVVDISLYTVRAASKKIEKELLQIVPFMRPPFPTPARLMHY